MSTKSETVSPAVSRREAVEHGTADFPVACYNDDLSQNEVPWHWHEELEAVVVEAGHCIVRAGRRRFVVEPGEGFFINTQILHGCWDLDISACRLRTVVFHPRLVGGSLESVFYLNYVAPVMASQALRSVHLQREKTWHIQALEEIGAAWQAYYDREPGFEFSVRQHLSQLILLLRQHGAGEQIKLSPKALRDSERIKQMLAYVQENFTEELRTPDIAAAASISESECLRCFRNVIGTTPIQYVRQYRIRRAAKLLAATDHPVGTVAEECGFQDVSYFTKTFRELRGCTPTEYRAKKQKK